MKWPSPEGTAMAQGQSGDGGICGWPLTGTVGNFAALMAIKAIVQIGEDPAGKVHLFDGEKLSWREIRIPADPGCRACGSA